METLWSNYMQNLLISLAVLILFRICLVLLRIRHAHEPKSRSKSNPAKLMVILGSGGHTFEMLKLLEYISTSLYSPRIYVIAETDILSGEKARQLETWKIATSSQKKLLRFLSARSDSMENPQVDEPSDYIIEKIPRSREVHQSWITTILSTVFALFGSVPLLFRHFPDVIVCNGPGTCVPVVFVAFMFAVLGFKKILVVYIESFCRVQTLSLTGRILYHLADVFIVQWPQLKDKYPRAKYYGLLV